MSFIELGAWFAEMAIRYRCAGYFALVPSRHGILYPFFNRSGLNVPFVQEIDRHSMITNFIEFTDLDEYHAVPSDLRPEAEIGHAGLVAFFDQGRLREGTFHSIGGQVRSGEVDLEAPGLPELTKLGLSRISGLSSSRHSRVLADYLTQIGLAASKVEQIARSDQRLMQSQESWWAQIFKAEFGQSEAARGLLDAPTEDIIYWLFENEVDDDWKDICAGLLRRVLFDERIADILSKFLSVMDDFADYDLKSKVIVGRGMDLYALDPKFGGDFADIMYEKIVDGSIFYLGTQLPAHVTQNFLQTILRERSLIGDEESIIDSLLDYFESEVLVPKMVPVIINVLFEADLDTRYSDKTYYSGKRRFDRFIDIYRYNPAIKLSLDDESLIDTMNEIVAEIEAEEEDADANETLRD